MPPAVDPAPMETDTFAAGLTILPTAQTRSWLVRPAGSTATKLPIGFSARSRSKGARYSSCGRDDGAMNTASRAMLLPSARRAPVRRSPSVRTSATGESMSLTPRERRRAATSGLMAPQSAVKKVTWSLHCRISSAWCSEIADVPSTARRCPRTSHPWQYGQCRTPAPHCCVSPGISGSSSTRPRRCDEGARRGRTAICKGHGESIIDLCDSLDCPRADRDIVGAHLFSSAPQQLAGVDPVASEHAVHMRGKAVARLADIDHQHLPARASQGQCRRQAGDASSNDDDFPVFAHAFMVSSDLARAQCFLHNWQDKESETTASGRFRDGHD